MTREAVLESPGTRKRPPTGIAGSDAERQAANRLAEDLRALGRSASIEPVSVRLASGWVTSLHALLALAGGLLAIEYALAGAALCLMAAFSFYSERALGAPLLGRLAPGRATQNVLSPPPGPAWSEVEIVLCAGYDLERSQPVAEWLARRFSGRLTLDRVTFWGGMVPVFLAAMLNVAAIESLAVQILQLFGSAVLLAVTAAQVDAWLAEDPEADDEDLEACRDLLAVLDELLAEPGADPAVAICLFGAETRSAAGAAAFFAQRKNPIETSPVVVNFVRGAEPSTGPESRIPVLLTAKEGDLATLRMSYELGSESPIEPERAILRRTTGALLARRRGLRATTVVGRGERSTGLGLDLVEQAFAGHEAADG
jgi:hypothetical protein